LPPSKKARVPLTDAAANPFKAPQVKDAARGFLLRGLSGAGQPGDIPRAFMRPPSETHYECGNPYIFV
jgi:hypothetical protein